MLSVLDLVLEASPTTGRRGGVDGGEGMDGLLSVFCETGTGGMLSVFNLVLEPGPTTGRRGGVGGGEMDGLFGSGAGCKGV